MAELRGHTVVVIGGSAGIGLETARRARVEGAEVILIGRNQIDSTAPHLTWVRRIQLRSMRPRPFRRSSPLSHRNSRPSGST
jgi:NAD(P)-dependent dehydrogenase (short-subunit alcohol dehydrogenase family)